MIISLLKKRKKLIVTAQNKIKIMFKTHFLFSLTMFMKNVEKFNYFSLINDETLMTRCEIIKVIHKINLNKIFEINKIINKILRQLARVVVKQIYFLFNKYIKKNLIIAFQKDFYNNVAKIEKKIMRNLRRINRSHY